MKTCNNCLIIFLICGIVFACSRPIPANNSKDETKGKIFGMTDLYATQSYFARDRGLEKLEKGDYKNAIVEFTIAIDNNVEPVEGSYFLRGFAKSLMNRKWSAIYDYSRAININPERGEYYTSRAEVLFNLGLTKWCCKDLAKAKKLGDINAEKLIEKYCNRK